MIVNFSDGASEDIFNGVESRRALRFSRDIWTVAKRKLDMLNAAHDIKDLRVPPGNRLEKLHSKEADLYSIRINDRFRIIFKWADSNARDVRITDYH